MYVDKLYKILFNRDPDIVYLRSHCIYAHVRTCTCHEVVTFSALSLIGKNINNIHYCETSILKQNCMFTQFNRT